MHTTEQLNTALADRYAIERLIGRGGMATVYLAGPVSSWRRIGPRSSRRTLIATSGVGHALRFAR
jgi:hypothetical protein